MLGEWERAWLWGLLSGVCQSMGESACNHSTQETKARISEVRSQQGLHSEFEAKLDYIT